MTTLKRCCMLLSLATALVSGLAAAAPVALGPAIDVDDGMQVAAGAVDLAKSRTSGNFIVVWPSARSYPVTSFELRARRYAANGAPLGAEFTVAADILDAASAMGADGAFVIAWRKADGLYARAYSADGVPSGAVFRIDDDQHPAVSAEHNNQSPFSIALTPAGQIITAWLAPVTESILLKGKIVGKGLFVRRRAGDGTALDAVQRIDVPLGLYLRAASPRVMSAADGSFVVAWTAEVNPQLSIYLEYSGSSVFFRRYGADGAASGLPVDLGIREQWGETNLAADMNGAGEFVLEWAPKVGTGEWVTGQHFSKNGILKGTQRQKGCAGTPCTMAAGLDDEGESLLAWNETTGTDVTPGFNMAVYAPTGLFGALAYQGRTVAPFSDDAAVGPQHGFAIAGIRPGPADALHPIGRYSVQVQLYTMH